MILLEEAKQLKPGAIIHEEGMDLGHKPRCYKWRVNGKVKTWKRNPEKIQVPLKHGLYDYGYLHEHGLNSFHFEKNCITLQSNRKELR